MAKITDAELSAYLVKKEREEWVASAYKFLWALEELNLISNKKYYGKSKSKHRR